MGRFAEALADAQRLARGDTRGIIVDTLQIIDGTLYINDEPSDEDSDYFDKMEDAGIGITIW